MQKQCKKCKFIPSPPPRPPQRGHQWIKKMPYPASVHNICNNVEWPPGPSEQLSAGGRAGSWASPKSCKRRQVFEKNMSRIKEPSKITLWGDPASKS